VRSASEASGLDRRILGNDGALAADIRLTEPIVFRAEMVEFAIAFGTKEASFAIIDSRELRQSADITAAKVMQEPLIRETRSPTPGAYFAHVQMVAPALGAKADPVEEALPEVIPPGEKPEIAFAPVEGLWVFVTVLG
jgi:hypothetical protein